MARKAYPKPRYDQNLVADQPGRLVFFTGLIIALVFGLLFRGAIAPPRIQSMVEMAAANIHKDVKVDFESAFIRLSERGLPRLSLVVQKVNMRSENLCWGRPLLTANEVVLPISFLSLVLNRQPLKKVLAKNAELRLRAPIEKCPEAVEEPQQESSPHQAVTLVHRRSPMEVSASPTLNRLEIDRLKFAYDPDPRHGFEVVDLSLFARSHQPKHILLEARTHLLKDPLVHDFISSGKLYMEYKEFPVKVLKVNLLGNWREGHYSLQSNYKIEDKFINTSVELKHIPGAQIVEALKSYGWLHNDLDGRRIWITMKGQTQGSLEAWQKLPLTISQFNLEGDLGEIDVPYFQAVQLQPLVFEPIKAKVKGLHMDRLLELLKRERSLKFLGHLGEFTGDLELQNENQLFLTGRHSGLEFIFSNRGHRELQVVNALDGQMRMRNNTWELDIKNVDLKGGAFRGRIEVKADRDFKDIDVMMKSEELTLAPAIQKLMSGGGNIGPIKSQVSLSIEEGRVQDLKGYITTPEVKVDALRFENLASHFNMTKEQMDLRFSSQTLDVENPSPAFNLLQQVTAESTETQLIRLKNLKGRFVMNEQNELRWKDLNASGEKSAFRLSSKGQWNREGGLSGEIFFKQGRKSQTWKIMGHRDSPQLQEKDGAPRTGP